jgi:hypothetical protein
VGNQNYCAIGVGGCFIVGEGVYIAVDGERLLSLGFARPAHTMTLSVALYDKDDNLLAVIEDNEWISGDPFPWDIESDHQRLSIRREAGDISLSIDARREPAAIRAQLWRGGHSIRLTPDGIRFGADTDLGGVAGLGLAGMALDLDPTAKTLRIIPDPRFGMGFLVSESDSQERLRRTIDAWARTRRAKEREIGRNGMCWCGSGLKLKRCHAALLRAPN